MAELIARNYGNALFEVALEKDALKKFEEEAELITAVLVQNEELNKLLFYPAIAKQDKLKFLAETFEGKIADELLGLMVLVVKKDRTASLHHILEYFIARSKAYQQVGRATVVTAVELSAGKKAELEARLMQLARKRQLEVTYLVDESIIGGMIVRIGDRVVDSSIRSKLEGLSKELNGIMV